MKIKKSTFNANNMNFRRLKTQRTVNNSMIFSETCELSQKPLRFDGFSKKEVIEQIGLQ